MAAAGQQDSKAAAGGHGDKAKGVATYRSNKLKCMTNPLRLTKVGLLLLLHCCGKWGKVS